MATPLYTLIDFPRSDTGNGVLYMFEPGAGADHVPFEIRKVLAITGMQGSDARGAHTHHKTRQILLPITGGCTVDLDDGSRKESVVLDTPNRGLLLNPYVWHVMREFKPNTLLLALADQPYDESEYIRDYDAFLGFVKEREGNN
jgi:hypothetical protein